jgi:membrane protease YdiL (CAAX protease family)
MGYLRSLSPRAEFAAVLLIAFGYPILISLGRFSTLVPFRLISGSSLMGLMIFEPLVLILLGWFLRSRGWTLARLGLGRPGWSAILIGIGLFLVSYIVYRELWFGLWYLTPTTLSAAATPPLVAPGLGLPLVVAISLLNPIFEEVFVCGYIVSAIARPGRHWPAIHASVAVRLLYHLYQGPAGIIAILPIGLIFAGYFARTRQLWPLLIAHALFDLASLVSYIG